MKGVRRPAPHPMRWAYDVVRASYRLPAVTKHVWRIINEFDSGQGCWASPALLARLVGLSVDEFALHVTYLDQVGLVVVVPASPTTSVLFAALPSDFPTLATLRRD